MVNDAKTGVLVVRSKHYPTIHFHQSEWEMLSLFNLNRSRTEKQIYQLHGIHNTAARLDTDTGKYEHITPNLNELHLLPIDTPIVYKIILINFTYIHGLSPAYVTDLLTIKPPLDVCSENATSHDPVKPGDIWWQRVFTFCTLPMAFPSYGSSTVY